MAKLLLLIVLVGLVLLAWKTLAGIARARDAAARRRADEAGAPGTPGAAGAGGSGRPPADEPMLRCAHCGVHFPASEVVAGDGLPFCSASHRDAGPRGG